MRGMRIWGLWLTACALVAAGCGFRPYMFVNRPDGSNEGSVDGSVDGAMDADVSTDVTPPEDGCVPCETIPPPRPVWPPNGSTVYGGGAGVRFVVELPDGVDGVVIDLCEDPSCSSPNSIDPGHGAIPLDRRVTTESVTIAERTPPQFWRARGIASGQFGIMTGPVWQFMRPPQSTAQAALATNVAFGSRLDVNADGFVDLAIAEPDATASGQVDLFPGSNAGNVFPSAPTCLLDTTDALPVMGLGWTVAAAGDIDGDGRIDLVAGASSSQHAFLWTQIDCTGPAIHAATLDVGLSGPSTLAVAPVGDFDRDGYADVLVFTPSSGVAWLLRGAPDGMPLGNAGQLPSSVRTAIGAADFDGDGYSDFAIGDPVMSKVVVYFGGPAADPPYGRNVEVMRPAALSVSSEYGEALAAADLNADGRSELLIGAPAHGSSGAVVIVKIAAGRVPQQLGITMPAATVSRQGSLITALGDVNDDRMEDVLLAGVSSGGTLLGWIYGDTGAGPGNLGVLGAISADDSPNFAAGVAMSVAGGADFTGDGRGDLVVSGVFAPAGPTPQAHVLELSGTGAAVITVGRTTLVSPGGATGFGAAAAISSATSSHH